MYTVLDVIEIGEAQELIRAELKDWFVFDDSEHLSFWVEPPWFFEDNDS